MSDLEAIRARHYPLSPRPSGEVVCVLDGQPWGEQGCDTAQVLAKLTVNRLAVAINDAQVKPDELRLGHDLRIPAARILDQLEGNPGRGFWADHPPAGMVRPG